MTESIYTGLATETAKGLVQLVSARALDEINLMSGFKDQLRRLNKKFQYVQAFLEDARHSKHVQKSLLVNLWVQKIKDVTYLADDIMDEYSIEIFRRKMELKSGFKKKFHNLFTHSNPIFFRVRMAHKVNDILSMFDELDKDARDIGFNQVDIAVVAVTHTYNCDHHLGETRQHATANASDFIGREHDKEKLLEFICRPIGEARDLSTVAIVGMGGMGKTTLARHLYDHERICSHFGNKKLWICVSEKFEITRILNEMIESVTASKSELSNTETIIRKLQEELKGSKFLLVFDDVWNDNEELWRSLKGLLYRIGLAPGSVILFNTRSDEVAKAADAVFIQKLKELTKDESWCLFHQIVFNNNTRPNFSGLRDVGKKIVEKCKGVPLAIKVIGGLLKSKQHVHEWESIQESQLWDLPHGQNQILPSLLLSYNHLPSPSIKQCFAYFAIIPKGRYAYKSELIGLWLSQGYIRNDKRKNLTMEEIGEEYLKILLGNLFLEECVSPRFGIVGYRLHDLVYDLAVYVCGSDLINGSTNLSEESCCRHLVLNSGENITTSNFRGKMIIKKLRTLHVTGTGVPWNMLIHARRLRTLFLDRTGITEVPPALELLKHLRFLDLSYNPISTLPDSVGTLYQLETLILQGCTNMKRLPKVLNKLVNLRHISTTAPMFAQKGLHQLINLRSLPSLSLDDDGDGWTIDELGDLDELRDDIHIQGLQCVKDKEQARNAMLVAKSKISKVTLSWLEGRDVNSCICDEGILESLEPHPNLTMLEVHNLNGENFPSWLMMTDLAKDQGGRLNNLTSVKLMNCIRCRTLPTLGQLPLLKCLTLSGLDVEVIGIEFYGGGDPNKVPGVSFQSLLELEISRFLRLTRWMVPRQTTFPILNTLRVIGCGLLESVPALRTNSLLNLELRDLKRVRSLDIIKESIGLTSLIVDLLPKIRSLPQELANCRKLQVLKISNCDEHLTSLPDGLLHGLSSLLELELVGCPSLGTMATDWEGCTSLESLTLLKCPLIKALPSHLSELRSSCLSANHLRSLLEAAHDLPHLRHLGIDWLNCKVDFCDYFIGINPFPRLPSLATLMLRGGPGIKTLPQQLGLLTQVNVLCIWCFEDLEVVPDWICDLTSLDSLIFENCANLKCLPSKMVLQRLTGLRCLTISCCPLLAERYAKDAGSEWHDISHIRDISINGKAVQVLDD